MPLSAAKEDIATPREYVTRESHRCSTDHDHWLWLAEYTGRNIEEVVTFTMGERANLFRQILMDPEARKEAKEAAVYFKQQFQGP